MIRRKLQHTAPIAMTYSMNYDIAANIGALWNDLPRTKLISFLGINSADQLTATIDRLLKRARSNIFILQKLKIYSIIYPKLTLELFQKGREQKMKESQIKVRSD